MCLHAETNEKNKNKSNQLINKFKSMKMKKITLIMICFLFTLVNIQAQNLKADIEKAQKAGKTIYLIVAEKTSKGTDALLKTAENAQKKAKNTAVFKLERDNKVNASLISKFRLAGASLPLVLVVAPNGVVAGSLSAKETTIDRLIADIPSKNQSDVLLGFENKKAAIIICGKKSAKDKEAIEAECKKALTSLGNKATLVFVDVDNKEEANFMNLLKPDLNKTTVIIFNGSGQYTGTLEANAKAAAIVTLANKKVGGCCPPGSGKKC